MHDQNSTPKPGFCEEAILPFFTPAMCLCHPPECAAVLGVVVLGPFMYARGPQLQHWLDMVNPTQEPVKQWHGLGRCL